MLLKKSMVKKREKIFTMPWSKKKKIRKKENSMTIKELNDKYGIRKCKCGEQLIPHKKLFRNVIIYTCPKSNIFNKKNHSISRAYFIDSPTLKFGTIINKFKQYGSFNVKNK